MRRGIIQRALCSRCLPNARYLAASCLQPDEGPCSLRVLATCSSPAARSLPAMGGRASAPS